jgi:hypothetical protein
MLKKNQQKKLLKSISPPATLLYLQYNKNLPPCECVYKIYAILKLYVTKVESINNEKWLVNTLFIIAALKIYAFNCFNDRLIAHFSSFSLFPFFCTNKNTCPLPQSHSHTNTHHSP